MGPTPEQLEAAEGQLLNSFFGLAGDPDSASAAAAADLALAELDALLDAVPEQATA
ncbi:MULTISPECIES: ABC transporter ATP-binding protein [unclassified Streptomyces]|uniref:ABC transporter ATP-binding protein n=1 Tax=unclassified Streptomyces TaxID=2593676 RepID=UPI0036A9B656